MTRVLDERELHRLHDRPLRAFLPALGQRRADARVPLQMMAPLKLGGAAGAGVGRLAGVGAQVDHVAVALSECRAAVRALVAGRGWARVAGSHMPPQMGGGAVEGVAELALYLTRLGLLVLRLPVEQHEPSRYIQLKGQTNNQEPVFRKGWGLCFNVKLNTFLCLPTQEKSSRFSKDCLNMPREKPHIMLCES